MADIHGVCDERFEAVREPEAFKALVDQAVSAAKA